MSAKRECHYVDHAAPTVGGFPQTCSGPITHRLPWAKGVNYYCQAHGEAHDAVSPFGGYEKVKR